MTYTATGNLYIVAAPSGGGKTSLVNALVNTLDNIEVSISHTTRNMRTGEQDGVHYFFIDEATFLQMIAEDAFVEHAKVFDAYYGTSVSQIKTRLQAGIDVVLDIDWQGAAQIRQLFPQSVSIFVLPPSLNTLEMRLLKRGRDDNETIAGRMQRAQDEMRHFNEFDYLIINEDFSLAAQQLQSIVEANRLTVARQSISQAKLLSILLS
jgi:guanylate kinase